MEDNLHTPKVLVCTGGIGSGKTYIAKIFQKLGVPVYYSDLETKALYQNDKVLLNKIANLCGSDVLEEGKINRKALAQIIFNRAELKEQLEEIVHPAVLSHFNDWLKKQESKFVIFESAIVLENKLFSNIACKILVVSAPLELRIERVINRDNTTREMVLQRISSQWTDKQRERMADFIIFADGNCELLQEILRIKQIMES